MSDIEYGVLLPVYNSRSSTLTPTSDDSHKYDVTAHLHLSRHDRCACVVAAGVVFIVSWVIQRCLVAGAGGGRLVCRLPVCAEKVAGNEAFSRLTTYCIITRNDDKFTGTHNSTTATRWMWHQQRTTGSRCDNNTVRDDSKYAGDDLQYVIMTNTVVDIVTPLWSLQKCLDNSLSTN